MICMPANVKQLQKEMFRKEHFPRVSMNRKKLTTPIYAVKWSWFVCRMQKAVSLPKVRFLILRVRCVPGEIWGGAVLRYFSALEEAINLLPVSCRCLYRRT